MSGKRNARMEEGRKNKLGQYNHFVFLYDIQIQLTLK